MSLLLGLTAFLLPVTMLGTQGTPGNWFYTKHMPKLEFQIWKHSGFPTCNLCLEQALGIAGAAERPSFPHTGKAHMDPLRERGQVLEKATLEWAVLSSPLPPALSPQA